VSGRAMERTTSLAADKGLNIVASTVDLSVTRLITGLAGRRTRGDIATNLSPVQAAVST